MARPTAPLGLEPGWRQSTGSNKFGPLLALCCRWSRAARLDRRPSAPRCATEPAPGPLGAGAGAAGRRQTPERDHQMRCLVVGATSLHLAPVTGGARVSGRAPPPATRRLKYSNHGRSWLIFLAPLFLALYLAPQWIGRNQARSWRARTHTHANLAPEAVAAPRPSWLLLTHAKMSNARRDLQLARARPPAPQTRSAIIFHVTGGLHIVGPGVVCASEAREREAAGRRAGKRMSRA